jgi:hypothetical protein
LGHRGATAGGSTSTPLVVKGAVPGEAQEQAATTESNSQSSAEEAQGPPAAVAVVVEQPKEREHEPPVGAVTVGEPSIIDIAGLLGTPTVMIVQSAL